MTPKELGAAAAEIAARWPDALIYTNPLPAANGHIRNPSVPVGALAVDVDAVWPHDCEDPEDCNKCCGWYELVAWIDMFDGKVHYTTLGAGAVVGR